MRPLTTSLLPKLKPTLPHPTTPRLITTKMAPLIIQSTHPLNSHHTIPLLGYGVYQTPITTTQAVVSHALTHQYRHIDSALAYKNEGPCASAMRASGIPRQQVFFTSKIPPKMVSYEAAKEAIETTLRETGLGYVDLMLIHAPYGGKEGREGAWRAMVEGKKVCFFFCCFSALF